MLVAINNKSTSINWTAKGIDRVAQNVFNLMQITRYDIPYNRTLGIPAKLTDIPLTELKEVYESIITDLIEHNEPRATVIEIKDIKQNECGKIEFEVVIDVVT